MTWRGVLRRSAAPQPKTNDTSDSRPVAHTSSCGACAHAPQLLVWATGLLSLVSFVFGCGAADLRSTPRHVISFLVGGGVTAIGLAAWWMRAPAWMPFCTLAGAGCYLG